MLEIISTTYVGFHNEFNISTTLTYGINDLRKPEWHRSTEFGDRVQVEWQYELLDDLTVQLRLLVSTEMPEAGPITHLSCWNRYRGGKPMCYFIAAPSKIRGWARPTGGNRYQFYEDLTVLVDTSERIS